MERKVLLSGIQPSGKPHIGNYFGAMKQFVRMQEEHTCLFMIADYHSLNTIKNADILKENIVDLTIDYLAIGIDSQRSIIFKQSDISEHTELAWIFDTITTMPYLARAHAFKDAELKDKETSVGLFNYPMLMAADILLYDADIVPVGADQKQHIEITRDTAQKFNHIYGTVFKLPEAYTISYTGTVPGIDGRKMSKSYGNTIPLFAEDADIERLVMSIVTDSTGGIPKNVFEIHRLLKTEEELNTIYTAHAGKYKLLKELLIGDLVSFIRPLREKRNAIAKDRRTVLSTLKDGRSRAKIIASRKMNLVREKIGVLL